MARAQAFVFDAYGTLFMEKFVRRGRWSPGFRHENLEHSATIVSPAEVLECFDRRRSSPGLPYKSLASSLPYRLFGDDLKVLMLLLS